MTESPLTTVRVGGLLLAGGQSRRFGAEKAVARFGEQLMMDAVAERFDPFADFAISARPGSAAATRATILNATILNDDPSLPSGPLAGVLEGLKWAHTRNLDFLVTAPCDAPLLPNDVFEHLLDAIGSAPAAFAATSEGEHPLCAVWQVALQTSLERSLRFGVHPSVRSFLAEQQAQRVWFDDARAFANANTVDALLALKQRA
ncbi:MAG: molybdenum cofactor guanylyltransferase [Terricaulis sp.]